VKKFRVAPLLVNSVWGWVISFLQVKVIVHETQRYILASCGVSISGEAHPC